MHTINSIIEDNKTEHGSPYFLINKEDPIFAQQAFVAQHKNKNSFDSADEFSRKIIQFIVGAKSNFNSMSSSFEVSDLMALSQELKYSLSFLSKIDSQSLNLNFIFPFLYKLVKIKKISPLLTEVDRHSNFSGDIDSHLNDLKIFFINQGKVISELRYKFKSDLFFRRVISNEILHQHFNGKSISEANIDFISKTNECVKFEIDFMNTTKSCENICSDFEYVISQTLTQLTELRCHLSKYSSLLDTSIVAQKVRFDLQPTLNPLNDFAVFKSCVDEEGYFQLGVFTYLSDTYLLGIETTNTLIIDFDSILNKILYELDEECSITLQPYIHCSIKKVTLESMLASQREHDNMSMTIGNKISKI